MCENTTPSTELPRDFCAGIGPLQLGVVLVHLYFIILVTFWKNPLNTIERGLVCRHYRLRQTENVILLKLELIQRCMSVNSPFFHSHFDIYQCDIIIYHLISHMWPLKEKQGTTLWKLKMSYGYQMMQLGNYLPNAF